MSREEENKKVDDSAFDGKSLLISGSMWSFLGLLSAGFLAVGLQAFLARILSPADVGLLAIIQSIVIASIVLADPGVAQYIPKLIGMLGSGNRHVKQNEVIKSSFVLVSVIYLFAGFLVGVSGLGSWLDQEIFPNLDLSMLIIYTFPLILLTGLLQYFSSVYRGLHLIGKSIFFGVQNAGIGTQLVFLIVLIVWRTFFEIRLEVVLQSLLFATLLILIWSFIGVAGRVFDHKCGWYPLREFLTHSYPIWGSTIGFMIIAQSGVWIIGALTEESQVALYMSAVRVSAFVMFPLIVINAVIPPIIARMYHDKQKASLEILLRQGATLTGTASLLLGSVLILFPESVLTFLFGNYYASAKWMLVALSIAQIVNVAAGSGGMVLNMTGYQRSLAVLTMVNIFILLAFGIGFAIPFGANGVAVAIALALIVQNLLMVAVVRYRTGLWIYFSFAELKLLHPTRLMAFARLLLRPAKKARGEE